MLKVKDAVRLESGTNTITEEDNVRCVILPEVTVNEKVIIVNSSKNTIDVY